MEEEKEEDNPRYKLKLIMDGKLGHGADNIDTLYRQVLNFHFSNSKETLLELLRSVMGRLLSLKYLSVLTLSNICWADVGTMMKGKSGPFSTVCRR
jgi:hypothetical protein